MKKIIICLMMLFIVTSCRSEQVDLSSGVIDGIKYEETSEVTNYIKIEMEDNNLILLELFPDVAPITVENFQNLVSEKFYDGSVFHRVVENFMIQGGISATGRETDAIKGEFAANGIENTLSHKRGVISMARTNVMDSATSQFFIMHRDTPGLDREYAAFGEVIAGISTVDKIATTPTRIDPMTGQPRPVVDQVIRSIRFINIIED